MSQFQQPAISNPEDKFVAAEHNGALLLFFPSELQLAIPTAHGTSDAVKTRIVNLNTGRVIDNALVFATALVTQLRAAVPDGMVLGRLGQGTNTKGNPPWLLSPHTEPEVAVAEAWLAANPRGQFSQPQAQAAPPTPAAYAAPPIQQGWSPQPSAPAAPAPATGGWGSPAPQAEQGQFAGQWGGAAPVAPPAPVSDVPQGLVDALAAKGINLRPGATRAEAEGIWAVVGNQ